MIFWKLLCKKNISSETLFAFRIMMFYSATRNLLSRNFWFEKKIDNDVHEHCLVSIKRLWNLRNVLFISKVSIMIFL